MLCPGDHGLKFQVSRLFCFQKGTLNTRMWAFYGGARNVWIATGTTPGICCDPVGLTDLLAYKLVDCTTDLNMHGKS
jgi:hypothetical protein